MKKELSLVKTSVGFVSKHTLLRLSERALEIAQETDIKYDEAMIVLLRLITCGDDGWLSDGNKMYFENSYNCDCFVVNKWCDHTEIVSLYNDKFIATYNVENKKYYREYDADNDLFTEEISFEI